MGGLRRWMRNLERSSRETAGTITLLDTETGETFEAPKDAFLHVLGSLDDVEPEPEIAPLLGRLGRLVVRDSGQPFWLTDMTHTGKTASEEDPEDLSE